MLVGCSRQLQGALHSRCSQPGNASVAPGCWVWKKTLQGNILRVSPCVTGMFLAQHSVTAQGRKVLSPKHSYQLANAPIFHISYKCDSMNRQVRFLHWARAHLKLLNLSVFLEITVAAIFISTIPTRWGSLNLPLVRGVIRLCALNFIIWTGHLQITQYCTNLVLLH